MRQSWWKVLCVLLLFYTLFASYLIPLHSGLLPNENNQLEGNEVVEIIGYNTHFTEASQNQAILGCGPTRFCAEIVSIDSDTRMSVRFDLPDTLYKKSLNLFVNNEKDGTMFLQGAFFKNSAVVDTSRVQRGCEIDVKTEKSSAFAFPFQPTIFETIRNLMFHVPMWFTMFLIMLISVIHSVRYLANPIREYDLRAETSARVGLLFAILGLVTGSIWARFTWGAWWVSDPQLNGAFVTFLIYVGYLVLRSGITDDMKRARVSAVFNIFAYVILFILLMILPKFTESLHPGKGGNPGFNTYDLNSSLRAVFYPAVLGWILLGVWIYKIQLRRNRLRSKLYYNEK
jgi:heme exporter protein C